MQESVQQIFIEKTSIRSLPSYETNPFVKLSVFFEKGNDFLLCHSVEIWYELLRGQCYFNSTCQLPPPFSPLSSPTDVDITLVTEEIESTTVIETTTLIEVRRSPLSLAIFISGIVTLALGVGLLTVFLCMIRRPCSQRRLSSSLSGSLYLNPIYRPDSPYYANEGEDSNI